MAYNNVCVCGLKGESILFGRHSKVFFWTTTVFGMSPLCPIIATVSALESQPKQLKSISMECEPCPFEYSTSYIKLPHSLTVTKAHNPVGLYFAVVLWPPNLAMCVWVISVTLFICKGCSASGFMGCVPLYECQLNSGDLPNCWANVPFNAMLTLCALLGGVVSIQHSL
jgi:hypothetical protein